ncbi:MAG: response regulator [Cytophagales bacterium]|nr:MAG: response regulator [Cytophagales bacterium]
MATDSAPWVWLVDDDSDDQLLVKAAFKQANPDVTVHTIDDGDQLLSQLNKTSTLPKLVLLDLNMARMGGFETLRAVRLALPDVQIPIVILTTSSNNNDLKQAIQQGANAFVSKPSEYGKLVELTKELSAQWL